jgi:hypothetical protein
VNISSALTGCALAAAVLVGVSTAAVAAPEHTDLVPLDQATIVDPDSVTPARGGLLTADGTNLCATAPETIAYPNGTYPCFIGFEAIPGGTYPVTPISLVPFEEATVIDPNTVTIVPGGVITTDGTDVCAQAPGSIVFPDGRYPCYINFVQTYGTFPPAGSGTDDAPQVSQLPVGGADTGVPRVTSNDTATGTTLAAGLLGLGILAAGGALAVRSRPGT